MENYKIVRTAAESTAALAPHKAFMITSTGSAGSAALSFFGENAGMTGAGPVSISVPASGTVILPLRVKATGAYSNCLCYMLD